MLTINKTLPGYSIEILITIVCALAFFVMFSVSPFAVTIGALGLTIAVPVLLKKPEYAVFFLVLCLPFRDIHLVSALHFKRAVIWGLFFYSLARQFSSTSRIGAPGFLKFARVTLLFVGMLIISLVKTASALYSNIYVTSEMLKSSILSDALFIVEGLLLVYIVYYFLETALHIQHLLDVVIVASVIVALLGIFQYYNGGSPSGLGFLYDPEYQFYGRATSIFSNPNGLGGFLAPMIVIIFASILGETSAMRRVLFLFPALLLDSWALLLSFSRGALLQVFFGILVTVYVFYFYIKQRKISWKVLIIAVGLVGMVFIAIQGYDWYLQTRVSAYTGQDYHAAINWIKTTNDFQRKHAAVTALQTFLKHPLLGIGYNLYSAQRAAGFEYFGLAVHNQFLELLAEMGLLGFLPFMLLLLITGKTGMMIWDRSHRAVAPENLQYLMLALLSGISAVLLGYLFADTLPFLPITGSLWILAGAVFVLERCLVKKS